MKGVLCFILFAALAFAADEKKSELKMPTTLHLTGGAVLRNVTVERWEKDKVVIRYIGGLTSIPYPNLAEPDRTTVLALRETAMSAAKTPQPPATAERAITGQVFVTTMGAGSYKFAGAKVSVYPVSILETARSVFDSNLPIGSKLRGGWEREKEKADTWTKTFASLSPPLAVATTDADGNYSVKSKTTEKIFLFCTVYRYAGGSSEYDTWIIEVGEDNRVDLNGNNIF